MTRIKFSNKDIEPDEVFMDSKNLPGFERGRFEGRLEFPISSETLDYLKIVLVLVFGLFIYRLYDLQVTSGDILKTRAEANHLKILPLWPERGRILDRRGEVLAGNNSAFRLVLDSSELSDDGKKTLVDKLLPHDSEQILVEISFKKDNIIIADSANWQTLEAIRREYRDLPLRIELFSSRFYPLGDAGAHLVGYLGKLLAKESAKVNSLEIDKLTGRSGAENIYENYLAGRIGSKLTEVDSVGGTFSEVVEKLPEAGDDVYLSIDADLQKKVYEEIKTFADDRGFRGGGAVLLDPTDGEVLSLVSYPGFDPNILTKGSPKKNIDYYLTSSSKPLFNRAISGLYSSGSIIKPLYAIAALEEGIITPEKEILSTGKLIVPNPFDPDQPSIFLDWKAHGWVDMRHAIAISSNVYFYTIGGGFGDVKGLGVTKLREWLSKFGFGEKTNIDLEGERGGFIPSPEWKAETQKEDPIWRVGDTYNLSIGQGNFQTTPVQMAVFAATIANGGKIMEPRILKEIKSGDRVIDSGKSTVRKSVNISTENLEVVREGMNLSSKIGTAQALANIDLKIAAKTGTAQIGVEKKNVNSWFIGYFPYDNPKIAMAVVLEGGSSSNLVGATAATRQIIEWILVYRPDLLK
ncbi:penicillin-binding protein 2 [Candidatus Giovannonibacteria bacterium RIFCSPLOWO2_02_FULL_43_11b]|uniref:Penicillin-binding protein 2 n=1 Tax=Candidatus Giovannonibacteria bacterium RIFCSPHIGHO2_12_FULL_43_15 TaxID=1798341 RepID=A0A1F5WQ51_9BACT|nr:MAG: penicillin-binding protein 2 [Candidatus Giovannonibacteria bacterium RIFCSPHIGHO2_01_FULL_43_100]OGF67291.1 MAG: penicillin-binding protein 2 [Candidatus Giovannonibacteria bacterium RIFCSPHIGHO2_02_FULL_43_32]OGF77779.1 MAG: penicillin-binding protein 2 [Candidatus Giovannonibacteria bacterium RIFCSPHIGHO2_12_FULL_43_15]OGF78572.1 MAG: penicillin-binding protein 2 [Candidatus Giovannonibacteria bacterium RIFCSPLOWO2_01_FULL_43_60]OGF90009.1 MAG: penicillin-binding protein 2 [Candidatu